MKDYYLHYEFTDRGGKHVFGVYEASDAKTRLNKLNELRLSDDELKAEIETNGHGTG